MTLAGLCIDVIAKSVLELKQYVLETGFSSSEDEIMFFKSTKPKLVWTVSKASLLELIYGLQSVKAFNNGNVELQQIATYFEKLFDVKLGNYHRAFQEIRERKKNRTQFLDDIKKRLIDKMDSMDDNLKH